MNIKEMNELKKCKCGHDKNHKFAIAHKQYTKWGEILQLIGISAQPQKIKYECIKCQSYFDETKIESELKKEL